jgi:predicted transcriptional regulator
VSLSGLGDQELALLRWIAGHDPASVGQAAAGFGEPRGLARSTVLTMMERLRRKRRLARRRAGGLFVYSAVEAPEQTLRGLVQTFVEKKLDGSLSPFVQYLTDKAAVSDEELAQLEKLVAALQTRKRKERRR